MTELRRSEAASDLPPDWDGVAPSYFQQREFLVHAERFNPCRQRYYAWMEGGKTRAGAIAYTLRLDLLTFLGIRSPVSMHIIGVPIGTATSGYFGDPVPRQELLTRVARRERGMLVTLNAEPGDDLPLGAKCRMIPTVLFDNRFPGWAGYVSAMRSQHRRRLHQIEALAERLNRVVSDCSRFTEAHHLLYRAVHDRAEARLENLSLAFFQSLPPRFSLASYYHADRLVSWTITVHDGTMFMYFFGGMDYALLKAHGSYFVGLENIVRDCIEQGHSLLDLGQTADDPKLRFGGRLVSKDMYLTHHNPIVRALLQAFHPLLEYRGRPPSFRVFKEEGVSA